MSTIMMRHIYALPLHMVIFLMLVLLIVWAMLSQHKNQKKRTIINAALCFIAAFIILYATILTRTPGNYELILTPFAALSAARQQPELYREMLMNVFLFFPLGLTLSNALPRSWHRWGRIILTTLVGCALSAGIEYAQYRCALGLAETDDVICNTLGAFIGSTSLLIAHAIEKHRERVRHILFEAVRKMPAAGENAALFAVTKQQVNGQVLNQTVRSAEFADLYRKLRSAGLHPIVVKGQLCSRLYPLKDHRISADDALYISDAEFMACHKQLLANGLTIDTPVDELATADEVSYTKKDSPLYIELHRHLFDSSEDTHDELNHFFTDLKPIEVDGFLTMPPHEHLLYLILHAYKHFVRSGIGARQFCDIGLWARAYHAEIDWQRLHEQCESVHAATFAAAAFRIARDYLGIDFDLPMPWDASIDVEPLLHDSLCGGVYGSNSYTRLHSSTVTLNAVKASRTGEKSSVLRTVFPKRAYLERRYPYLKKRPYLLPVAWVQRIVHYAGEKQSGADNSASGSIKLGKERIELMKRYGIIDEKK